MDRPSSSIGPVSVPLLKFSYTTDAASETKFSWSHVTQDLFLIFTPLPVSYPNTSPHVMMKVTQGTMLLEEVNLNEKIEETHTAVDHARDVKLQLRMEQLPTVALYRQAAATIAIRYSVNNDRVRRIQLKFPSENAYFEAFKMLERLGCPMSMSDGAKKLDSKDFPSRPSSSSFPERPPTSYNMPPNQPPQQEMSSQRPMTSMSGNSPAISTPQPAFHDRSSALREFVKPPLPDHRHHPAEDMLRPIHETNDDRPSSSLFTSVSQGRRSFTTPYSVNPVSTLPTISENLHEARSTGIQSRYFTPDQDIRLTNSQIFPQANHFAPLVRRDDWDSLRASSQLHHGGTSEPQQLPQPQRILGILERELPPTIRPSTAAIDNRATSNTPQPLDEAALTQLIPPRRELPFGGASSKSSSRPSSAINLPPLPTPTLARDSSRMTKERPATSSPTPSTSNRKGDALLKATAHHPSSKLSSVFTQRPATSLGVTFGRSSSPAQQQQQATPASSTQKTNRKRMDSTMDAPYSPRPDSRSDLLLREQQQTAPTSGAIEVAASNVSAASRGLGTIDWPQAVSGVIGGIEAGSLAEYAAMPLDERMTAIESMIVGLIGDDGFVAVVEDVNCCWRRIGLGE